MLNQKPGFRFEIDNFSEKKDRIASRVFVSGGCEWFLNLPQTAYNYDGRLSIFLSVANRNSLQTGWKRCAKFYFSVMNQSDKELYRSPVGQACYPFCAKSPSLGYVTNLPLSELQEKGFLEKDRLIIEVYIQIVEAVDGDVSRKNESVDSEDYGSTVTLMRKILADHPEIVEKFKLKNQVVNTEYMKLDRLNLKSNLGEFSLKSEKADDELAGKVPLKKKKKKTSSDADKFRVQQLEERIKNLELMENGSRLDNILKSKLEEISLEKKKSDAHHGSQVQQLEDRVKNLELMVSDLKVELDKQKAEIESSADGFLLVHEVA